MYVNMDILEETGLSEGPHRIVWEEKREDHPTSDKSGLSPILRIEAIWGYPPFLGNRDVHGPLNISREDHECRRGFPEAYGGDSGVFRVPGGGVS